MVTLVYQCNPKFVALLTRAKVSCLRKVWDFVLEPLTAEDAVSHHASREEQQICTRLRDARTPPSSAVPVCVCADDHLKVTTAIKKCWRHIPAAASFCASTHNRSRREHAGASQFGPVWENALTSVQSTKLSRPVCMISVCFYCMDADKELSGRS